MQTKTNSPKKRSLLWLDLTVGGLALVLISAGLWFGGLKEKFADSTICKKFGAEHVLTLKNDSFSPKTLEIKRCDVLRIVNEDTLEYHLAFGTHAQHVPYPGFTEQTLRPQEFIEVNAVQKGSYLFHDHVRDKAKVELTIR